jgi:hypothetical protein
MAVYQTWDTAVVARLQLLTDFTVLPNFAPI